MCKYDQLRLFQVPGGIRTPVDAIPNTQNEVIPEQGLLCGMIFLRTDLLCIQGVQVLDSKIISVAYFWASQQKSDLSSQLNLILPCHVKDLIGATVAISMEKEDVIIPMLGAGSNLHGEDARQNTHLQPSVIV